MVRVVDFLCVVVVITTDNTVKYSMSWFGNERCEFIDLGDMTD